MTDRIALYPGTFDPVTLGHLDLIRRGAALFDRLLVCVTVDGSATLLPQSERVALIEAQVEGLPNVEVEAFSGLVVEHARRRGAKALLRGVRTVRDFEYELEMAFANRELEGALETLFLAPSPATALVSSTIVREVASLGGDVTPWVPPGVAEALRDAFAS